MKRSFGKKIAATVLAATMLITSAIPALAAEPKASSAADDGYMVVGYAFQRGTDIEKLDLSKITHLNYSFGLIYNEEGNPSNPDCFTPQEFDPSLLHTIYLPPKVEQDLERLPALKAEKNPDLKLMLSVGGYNARGFSDAAATDESRKAFARSCKEVIDKYQLDGIDLDWEYPTIDWGDIKISPDDPQNFTLLLQEVRNAIGNDKLLSIAGSANVKFSSEWTEFDKIIPILDYINIMTYDFQYETCYYGSALYASTKWPTFDAASDYNADMAIARYIRMGCPAEKINLGIAYGATTCPSGVRFHDDQTKADWAVVQANLKATQFSSAEARKDCPSTVDRVEKYLLGDHQTADGKTVRFDKKWDADACMTYICTYDDAGRECFYMSYTEPATLSAKTEYVKEHGLGGVMFWEFGSDYENRFTTQLKSELDIERIPVAQQYPEKDYMSVGYAFQRGLTVENLDLGKITHLNYSFGLIYNSEGNIGSDGKPINPDCQVPEEFDHSLLNTIYLPPKVEEDLLKLPALKAEKNPDLKVMLSVGGYNARGFSDAAATEEARKAFAKSCKDVIDKYDLDGIDLDWEYPTIDWGDIKIRPEDPQNFTLLLQEVRNAIGSDKLLSIAGSANVNFSTQWTEFDKIVPLLDYINIMTYDFQYETCYYGSALYASTKWPTKDAVSEYNADMAIRRYIRMGCPAEKINLGISFGTQGLPSGVRAVNEQAAAGYKLASGRIKYTNYNSAEARALPTPQRVDKYLLGTWKDADGKEFRFDKKWDADAAMTYICTYDDEGNECFYMSYTEPATLSAKVDYVKRLGLGGTMFWQFGGDRGNYFVTQLAEEMNLYERPDTATLQRFIDTADGLVADGTVDKLIPAFKTEFEAALAAAKETINLAGPTKDQVFDAALRLLRAIGFSDYIQADKTALQMAVDLANEIKPDLDRYDDAGKARFNAALAAAEAVLADENALQDAVDAAWDELVSAMEALRFKVDKSVLEALLAEINAMDLTQYTDESVKTLLSAVEAGNAVYADGNSTQEAVDAAVEALKTAKSGLALKTSDGGENPPSKDDPKPSNPDKGDSGKDDGNNAQTGDNMTPIVLVSVLLIASLGVFVVAKKAKAR